MNKLIIHQFIAFFTLSVFLTSCENNQFDYGLDKYYEEIVTAMGKNVFLLDDGKTILNVNENETQTFQSGERIFLNYTLLPKATSDYDYTVRVNGASKITLGKLNKVSQQEIESSAKEPVHLESVWLGNHYLNMQFYINRKSESHIIGLLTDSTQLANDTIQIYFKHDLNNDPAGYLSHVFLSFDLENVLGKPENKKNIAVNINTDNYGAKIYELKY
jgi:hypothetical protein